MMIIKVFVSLGFWNTNVLPTIKIAWGKHLLIEQVVNNSENGAHSDNHVPTRSASRIERLWFRCISHGTVWWNWGVIRVTLVTDMPWYTFRHHGVSVPWDGSPKTCTHRIKNPSDSPMQIVPNKRNLEFGLAAAWTAVVRMCPVLVTMARLEVKCQLCCDPLNWSIIRSFDN